MAIGSRGARSAGGPGDGAEAVDPLVSTCQAIFVATRHLHGLTKPTLRVLLAAAETYPAWIDSGGQWKLLKPRLSRLSARGRRLVRRALQACSGAAIDWQPSARPKNRRETELNAAARMAAILRLAAALAGPASMRLIGVRDDGRGVTIFVKGVREQVAAEAMSAAGLWNELALRPITAITTDPPPNGGHQLAPGDSLAAAARRIFQRQLEQLLSREYGLGDSSDTEYVHEMRVAIRRLRAAIRIFGKAFPGGLKRQSARLKELADILGKARDADVLIEFLESMAKRGRRARPYLAEWIDKEKRSRRRYYRKLRQSVTARGQRRFLDAFYAGIAAENPPPALGPSAYGRRQPVVAAAERGLGRGLKRVLSFPRRLANVSAEKQHELRIACKKLRYACEFFAELYPADLQRLTAAMVRMQDELGKAHDADVYRRRLERYHRRLARKTGRKSTRARRAVEGPLVRRHRRFTLAAARSWKAFTAAPALEELRRLISSPKP